jgi:hypothetical protein
MIQNSFIDFAWDKEDPPGTVTRILYVRIKLSSRDSVKIGYPNTYIFDVSTSRPLEDEKKETTEAIPEWG